MKKIIKKKTGFIFLYMMILSQYQVCGQQLNNLNKSVLPGEDIWLHTDRDEYIAGEDCWFSAYLFDRNNNNKQGVSTVAYIELLNSWSTPVVQKRIRVTEGTASGTIRLPDTLSTGIYVLRAYTNIMKNFTAGQCFVRKIGIYNMFNNKELNKIIDEKADTPDTLLDNYITGSIPSICKRRDKIELEIILDSRVAQSPENIRLSVSVASSPGAGNVVRIDDYLNVERDRETLQSIVYKPETEGYSLSGRLISQKQDSRIGNQILFLSVPGKEAYFQYTLTDDEGNFSFLVDSELIPDEVIISQKENGSDNLIRILSPFLETYQDYDIVNEPVQAAIPVYVDEWSMNYQVSKIYGISSEGGPVSDSPEKNERIRFYGTPELELNMADYILLPAMQEVFFELIPGVAMRTGRSRYGITVTNPYDNMAYDEDATLMVDGVIIDDPQIIVEMNPENVERIDVIRREYVVGGYHFYGIVNVITKSGRFDSFPLPENSVRFSYALKDEKISFVTPDYSAEGVKERREPDFRNTLYWNPDIRPDNNGRIHLEFWTSDYRSDYVIDIQGLTTDGIPLSFRKFFTVK